MGAQSSSNNEYGSPYKESYPYQEPNGRDGYGNPTYDVYKPQYAYQNPYQRDEYGNPMY